MTKRPRGRPRAVVKKNPERSTNMEEVFSGPSYPLELVTTKVGGMKAAFQNHCFEFHFNRDGNKFWRCISHKSGCPSKIVSKGSIVYPICINHNHSNESFVFVETTEIVAKRSAPTTADSTEANIEPTKTQEKQPTKPTETLAHNLKEKLKERFAALKKAKDQQN